MVLEIQVVLVLPAVAIEPLPEVALVVVQPDADQRHAEIGRRLDVIAGEDAEAAGVDRQRLVQAELGGEVRDRARAEHAGVAAAPRVAGPEVLLHPAVGVVDAAVQRELRRALLQVVDRDVLEQGDRVVAHLAPRHRIELAEQCRSYPRPSSTTGSRTSALSFCRAGATNWPKRPGFADDRPELGAGGRQHPHIVVGEDARLGRLDDEHALEQAAVDDRHAQKRIGRDPRRRPGST